MTTTLVVSARVDARDVASLTKAWLKQTGVPPRSTSSLVSDALATLVQSLEQASPDIHVETVEEAYEIIRQCGMTAQSARSQRRITAGLQQEALQGIVPRSNGQQTLFNQQLTQHKPKTNEMEREIEIATAVMEHHIKTGAIDPDEGAAQLIAQLAKIRAKHTAAQQQRIKQATEIYKQSREQPARQPQASDDTQQIARADMTPEQREAFEKAELQRLKNGLRGVPSNSKSENNVVANNRETAIAEIERQAEKRSIAGVMSTNEIEQWRQQQLNKVNKLYDSLEPQPQS